MSADTHALKHRPIPSSAAGVEKRHGYRTDVPIQWQQALIDDPCVDVRDLGIAGNNHYNTPLNPPYYLTVPGSIPQLYLRREVANRLVAVNARLAPLGISLYLFDGWRPQAIQQYFHDVWFPDWLRQRRPDLEGAALVEEVEKYWAAPSDGPDSPSPHATGGAVDLTLIFTETRQPLYMGGVFDELTELAWADHYERAPINSMSDEEARANRRLLYWAMIEQGFAPNPTEWWHYSWGDQAWARMTDQSAAVYAACDPTAQILGLKSP